MKTLKLLIGEKVMVYCYRGDISIRLSGTLSVVWCADQHEGYCKVTHDDFVVSFYESSIRSIEPTYNEDTQIAIWEIGIGAGNVSQQLVQA